MMFNDVDCQMCSFALPNCECDLVIDPISNCDCECHIITKSKTHCNECYWSDH